MVSDSPKNTQVLISAKGDIMEGHVVNLTCISNANPLVKRYAWYKVIGGQPWAKGSSQNLTFTSVRSHHGGQYYCTVWNVLGMGMSPPVTLSVLCKCSPIHKKFSYLFVICAAICWLSVEFLNSCLVWKYTWAERLFRHGAGLISGLEKVINTKMPEVKKQARFFTQQYCECYFLSFPWTCITLRKFEKPPQTAPFNWVMDFISVCGRVKKQSRDIF